MRITTARHVKPFTDNHYGILSTFTQIGLETNTPPGVIRLRDAIFQVMKIEHYVKENFKKYCYILKNDSAYHSASKTSKLVQGSKLSVCQNRKIGSYCRMMSGLSGPLGLKSNTRTALPA